MLFLVVSCFWDTEDARDDVRKKYGPPEEVSTYTSGNYATETWWYWCQGISFTFKRESGCGGYSWYKHSTYTFSPICSAVAEEEKEAHRLHLRESLKLLPPGRATKTLIGPT